MKRFKVFIDGNEGTTGLRIHQLLSEREDIELLAVEPARRKDPDARQSLIAQADVVVLCLPDAAARESVALAEGTEARILDASTAHRVHPQWVYGLPELAPAQRQAISRAPRVANPGCYATGFILAVRPLIEAGLVPANHSFCVYGASGYTGGGRKLIEEYEAEGREPPPYFVYGLSLEHKHLPEMKKFAGCDNDPVFIPSVFPGAQGMLVTTCVDLASSAGSVTGSEAIRVLQARYQSESFVEVVAWEAEQAPERIVPDALNGTNRIRIHAIDHRAKNQLCLISQLDNLGKGASLAAVQNLNLMMGIDEAAGLPD